MAVNYHLDKSLEELNDLSIFEADEKLRAVHHAVHPLVLFNAGPKLFAPDDAHQMWAKGVVFDKDTSRVVSMPLKKMWNHFESEFLPVPRFDELRVYKKWDGTMIQVFRYKGEIIVTTRGSFDNEYIDSAKRLIDPNKIKDGYTYVYELLDPELPNVIRYGGEARLEHLATYNLNEFRYELDVDQEYESFDDFMQAVDHCMRDDGEGGVICFVKDGVLFHREKVKTSDYIAMFRAYTGVSLKTCIEYMNSCKEYHDIKLLGIPEELESEFLPHFNVASGWAHEAEIAADLIELQSAAMDNVSRKEYALHFKPIGEDFKWYMKAYEGKFDRLDYIKSYLRLKLSGGV